MKNLVILLVLMILTLPLTGEFIKVTSASETDLYLEAELPQIQFGKARLQNGENYDNLIFPGNAQNPPGSPNLPLLGEWILIPNGNDVTISVIEGIPVYHNDLDLAPVQHHQPDLVDAKTPEFIIDQILYSTDEFYPGEFTYLEPVKKKRGQECSILWIYPYQYNPVTRQLASYPDLEIHISFAGVRDPIPTNLFDPVYLEQFGSLALNGEEILSTEPALYNTDVHNTRDEGCDLLIITHPEFLEAAQTLASWKRKKALITKVVTLDETGYETEAIDNFINTAAADWDPVPTHLLLFGDSEFIPTWYITEHPYDNGQGYTAADVYYSDIDEPQDLIADMSLGRIPANNLNQALAFVNKVIQYEQSPPQQTDFYHNITCAAYFQDAGGGYAERRFAKTSEDVRNFLYENSYDVTRIYYTESDVDPLYWNVSDYVFENDIPGGPLDDEIRKPQFPWTGNAADINQAINIGSSLVMHRDHGYRLGWGDPAYSIYDISGINNGDLLPMVWTINCNTGWFDNETDDNSCGTAFDSESFVEYFMNHDNGGTVGMIGSTRVSYSGNNDRLVWGFMNAIWPDFLNWCTANYPEHDPIYKMGDVVNYGKEYFLANSTWGGDVRTTTLEQFLWFGDPTTEMWTAVPDSITVTHEQTLALGATQFTVNCPVENADVALVLADKVIAKGQISGGSVTLEFSPIIEIQDLELGVSYHNYIPYVTSIDVIPTGPYVICDNVLFHETGDYVDGSIQALDLVNIDLDLYNIGIEPTGDEILINLSTDSEFVEVLTGTASCTSIDDSVFYLLEDAFQILLNPGMEDGSYINFDFTMESEDEVWPGSFQLQVNSPDLEFLGYTLNITSGNDDILDPQETAEITFDYMNSGNGFSYDIFTTLSSNDPYIQINGMDIIGQIDPLSEGTSAFPLTLTVSPDCPIDYYIEMSLLTFDNAGSVLIRDFAIPIGILVYNFDDGSGIWESSNLDEDYLDQWHISESRNFTPDGSRSMKCGSDEDENYSNNVFAALYTPQFQAVPGTMFRFRHWMNTGLIGDSLTWDGGILEISLDGGEFEQIEPVQGYPAQIINLDIFPFPAATPVFAGTIEWEEVEVDLSDHIGSVQIRFIFGTSPTMYTMEGWYIDDVQIVNMTDSEENEIIPISDFLAQNHPNPFNPETAISFSIAEDTPVTLEIYNIKGQKIKTLVRGEREPGNYKVIWQGDDAQGQPAASGIYFYKLDTNNSSDVKKMILMK